MNPNITHMAVFRFLYVYTRTNARIYKLKTSPNLLT
jgi:hypothetical protein